MRAGPVRLAMAALCALALTPLSASAQAQTTPQAEARKPPNILIVVLDDVGFTDLGAYGSEIRTPNFDAVAARGVQFSQFRVAPTCAPTRAMLMTGVDSHLTGVPTLDHLMLPEHAGRPGYEGALNRSVATIAEHLRPAGYASFIAGKWHLGHGPDSLPARRGFDRSFILDASGADNWEHRPYIPLYTRAEWWQDDAPAETLPKDFYSSAYLTDTLISYIDSAGPERPFFAVLSFQANHIPVQAPRSFVDGYDGVYDEGWTALHARRHAAAIARGLVPADAPAAAMHPSLRAWETLSAKERRLSIESRKVAAGMLEAADHHFGRLVAHLAATGRLENTLVIVLSDNGPEHNDPLRRRGFDLWLRAQGYGRDPATLGERRTYAFIGPEWAAASASPLSLFKFHAAEGGVRVPLLAAGPGVDARGLSRGPAFVTDIAPTVLDAAGAAPLGEARPFSGRSLMPVLTGAADGVRGEADALGMEMSGQIALYRGRHKLTRSLKPYGDGQWRLFDIEADPGETRDLAAAEPALFADMMAAYRDYAAQNNVLAVPDDYDADAAIDRRGNGAIVRIWGVWLAAGGLALLVLVAGAVLLLRRRAPR